MYFPIVPVAITLFLGLVSANSSSHLIRRDREPEFKGTFIMRDNIDYYSYGYLPIYNPVGAETYRFNKWSQPNGMSTSTLTYARGSQPMITLNSWDDACLSKTHYTEKDVPGGTHLSYKIDPRGIKSDRWSFSFVNQDGEEINYHYKRNVFNKGGKVYQHRKNRPVRYVAKLQEQIRWESWLNPGSNGASTFTLSYDQSYGISVELVTLMSLVLNRVAVCGL